MGETGGRINRVPGENNFAGKIKSGFGESENNGDNTAPEKNIYEKYANDGDGEISESEFVKPAAPETPKAKPDFLNNLAQLRQKYVNAANEKSSFIEDKPNN
jgi:hypothetical protein